MGFYAGEWISFWVWYFISAGGSFVDYLWHKSFQEI